MLPCHWRVVIVTLLVVAIAVIGLVLFFKLTTVPVALWIRCIRVIRFLSYVVVRLLGWV